MAAVILEPTAETETLIWEREGVATCQPMIAQSNWSTGQWSNKAGQIWSKSQKLVKGEGFNCKY